jgi:hypothetical protein
MHKKIFLLFISYAYANDMQLKDVGVQRLRDRSTKLFATTELEPNHNPGAIGII